jgi:uncharacterized membrane protein
MTKGTQTREWHRAAVGLGTLLVLVVALSALGTPALAASGDTADESSDPGVPVTPANFDVAIDRVDVNPPDVVPLDEGTQPVLEVSYTVTNTGGVADTQNITLDVGASVISSPVPVDSQRVSLEPGESYSGQFAVSDQPVPSPILDTSCVSCVPDEITVIVSSEDDTATKTVPFDQPSDDPATFEIDGLQTNSPVTVGEDLTADVQVTNTGDESGTQQVAVDAGPLGSDTTTLSLTAGASAAQTVTFATGADDAGTYTLAASTANDTASTGVEVRGDGGGDEAYFNVAIEDTSVDLPDPGQPILMSSNWGISVTVEYTVANTGNASDTQSIAFTVDQTEKDSETVTLGPGERHSGTFSASVPIFRPLSTQVFPSPPYETEVTVGVSSEDDTARETITVSPGEDPAEFAIEGVGTNKPVAGEDLVVDVRVTNTGDASGTQQVAVDAGEFGSDAASLTLAGGESGTQTFTFATSAGDAGIYELQASTDDDSATAAFAVKPADGSEANFDVTIDDTQVTLPDPGPVPLSPDSEDDIEFGVVVEYTVTNTGDASDTQPITFAVEGTARDRTTLSLDPGQSQSGTFTDDLAVLHEGESGLIAGVADTEGMYDLLNRSAVLPEPPFIPELTVSVRSEDDTARETISLDPGEDPPAFVVENVETNSPVTAGDDLAVDVTITNTGDVVDSQQVTVSAGALGSSSRLQLLAGGDSTTQTFTLSTGAGDAGSYTVRASTADDSATANATVESAGDGEANFDVSIEDTSVEVPDTPRPMVWPATRLDFTVVVDYAVENTGNASDSQPITLGVEGETRTKTEATLAAGERTTGTLSAAVSVSDILPRPQMIPEPPFTPAVTVSVSSADDTASERVTLEPPAEEPPQVVIDSLQANSPTVGDDLVVVAQLTNTGDAVASRTVSVDAGSLGSESTIQLIRGGETVVQEFTFSTGVGDAGSYTVRASTGDDSATATATVQPRNDSEAVFEVSIDDTRVNVSSPIRPLAVDASLDLNVTVAADYTVTNTGGANDSQTVVFAVDSEKQDTRRVTLAPGERVSGTFTKTLSMSDIERPEPPCIVPHGGTCLPHVDITISTDDDRASEDVTLGPGGVPMPVVTDSPPLDPDRDGLHDDVRGDGRTDILDVQALFTSLDDPALQKNAAAFKFSGVGENVSVVDVQALFNDLPEASG